MAAEGSEKERWGRRARGWAVVVLVVAGLGAFRGGTLLLDEPPSLGPTSDVTCGEIKGDESWEPEEIAPPERLPSDEELGDSNFDPGVAAEAELELGQTEEAVVIS